MQMLNLNIWIYINLGIRSWFEVFNNTKFTAEKKKILMGKHMSILEVHFWSFLNIFEAETNIFYGYKKVHVMFVI